MAGRKHINLKTKLAAALRELFEIPHADAKCMTETQIISLAQFDHNILHGIEKVDEHWNLTPRLIAPHREKSKKDAGIVAKARRIDEKWKPFMAALAAGQKPARERRSRFPQGRKLRSRPMRRSA